MESGHSSSTPIEAPATEYTHPVDYSTKADPVLQNINEALFLIENDIAVFESRLADLKSTRFDSQVMADMYISAQDHLIAALTTQIHLLKAKNNHSRQ